MRKMKWSAALGGTAGCTLRLVEQSQYCGQNAEERRKAKEDGKREVWYFDSWFGSIKSVMGITEQLGHESFGVVKTNHSGTPKEEIEKIMKDWPSGSYLVMECEEHGLWMIGYKYSYKKKGEHPICMHL